MSRAAIVAAVVMLCAPADAFAQSVRYVKYTPVVIVDSTETLLVEVEAGGPPTRVTIDFNPEGTNSSTIDLKDDGTGGDVVAGDQTYTVRLPAAPIRGALRADDVHNVFIGFLNLFAGTTRVFRGNLFTNVYGPDVGTYPIARVSQFVQTTRYLVNIHDPTYFASLSPQHVAGEFYRWYGDDYDVLNLVYYPMRFLNRTHSIVKNQVSGIGLALTDGSAQYGSAGRLLGISQFPIPTFFDGAETGHIHELGHQWINHLGVVPFGSGVPHWPKSSMAGGVMGFSIGGSGGEGGAFACDIADENGVITLRRRVDAPSFNDLDLYLMGLMRAADVRTQIVFSDQAAVASLTCGGQVFTGPVQRVNAQQVVAAFGERKPAAGEAPTTFRIGTILVTRDALASQETMWLYSWLAERGELRTRAATHAGFVKELGQPFFVAAGGRGSLDMHVELGPADFALVPTPGSMTVRTGSSATYAISALPIRPPFSGEITFTCTGLPAHASCSFAPARVTPGETGADTVLTIATRDGSAGEPAGLPVALGLALIAAAARSRRRAVWLAGLLSLTAVVACGGGGRPPSTGTPPGSPNPTPSPTTNTAPGTYTITVTGTSTMSSTRTTTVVLVVSP